MNPSFARDSIVEKRVQPSFVSLGTDSLRYASTAIDLPAKGSPNLEGEQSSRDKDERDLLQTKLMQIISSKAFFLCFYMNLIIK